MKRTKATKQQITKLKFSLEVIIRLINDKFEPDSKGCYSVETETYRFFASGDDYISVYYSTLNDKCQQYPNGIIHKSALSLNVIQNINEDINYEHILAECFVELCDLCKN